ncbi:hypothetical protein SAY87_020014 [Trapa incisa]|uniref:Bromo domain-containing protein n=1 Tax=Trapa incisa TaxID=236973 RepID=A0AAN7K044_9MYRT|nr:hypothetical protein SAY87_020014 [Trapa incisa]
MDFRKSASLGVPCSSGMILLPNKVPGVVGCEKKTASHAMEDGVDIDLREVYFLILHFLSGGPCQRTLGLLQNELLEHQLLPRRYHALFSRKNACSGSQEDEGISFPLNYNNLADRYPHVGKDHLVRLLKQLMLTVAPSLHSMIGIKSPSAADVPTLLGAGSFSLLDCDKAVKKPFKPLPAYLLWPHMRTDQVHGLGLREIGGGFRKHHRAPSVRCACHAIAKPSVLVNRMQNIKKLRGHRIAVYCAIFDQSGRFVITGSDDRLVKIWSMETAFCLASCRGHEGDITDLAVSSNNALVASASNDFVIRVWRLPDGVPISVLRGHTGAVTAIAFSPRPSSVYQLLSSSDDGTCRIWDARYSQCTPRIYMPKPPDAVAGKTTAISAGEPSSIMTPPGHQILCCSYNANGTVFVTGSSDTYARVWNAFKSNAEDPERPVHEMDKLSGHENDVNYVQFSGCSVAPRSSISETSKDENMTRFRNYWYAIDSILCSMPNMLSMGMPYLTLSLAIKACYVCSLGVPLRFCHDNIVTCSRDGSAIIWVPRSRRCHGKGGRWTHAYHLKVPPPPLPPQPPRGGPRQRLLPTPRGVNMIIWSLDNRFVLAAIMDCRICVWNAADGSLVHSLTGHNASSYVLDVHPWNPRIAMSAGYDGKAIVWDIWEGTPVQEYDIGRVKLVDGKFSPDGTSIVLSDDFGQIHLVNTGQGESQKDARYDQFFLGDYRPLIRDALGNVLDQESQLPPHRRNFQDPLCDSSLIPYPEPYQTMYQKRRLGALGMEWQPQTINFSVGPDFNMGQDYQVPPLADLERLMEPLPEFIDALYWEPDNEILTDDNDSEFDVSEEYTSEDERQSLSSSSYSDPECSALSDDMQSHRDGKHISERNRRHMEVELAFSGRRARKRNMDDFEGSSTRNVRSKKPKSCQKYSQRKSSRANAMRPQRVAARNALTMFSQYSGTSSGGEDEDDSEDYSSERDHVPLKFKIERNETDRKLHILQKEKYRNENPQSSLHAEAPESHSNAGGRKRLVLKLSLRDSKKPASSEDVKTGADVVNHLSKHSLDSTKNKICLISKDRASCSGDAVDLQFLINENREEHISEELTGACTPMQERPGASENSDAIRHEKVKVQSSAHLASDVNLGKVFDGFKPSSCSHQENEKPLQRIEEPSEVNMLTNADIIGGEDSTSLDHAHASFSYQTNLIGLNGEGNPGPVQENSQKKSSVLKFKIKGVSKLSGSIDDKTEGRLKQENQNIGVPGESDDAFERYNNGGDNRESEFVETATDVVRRKRSMKMKATSRKTEGRSIITSKGPGDTGSSRSLDFPRKVYYEHQIPTSRKVARMISNITEMDGNVQDLPRKRDSEENVCKQSWLMLYEPEEGYRYIPQMSDEVIYLRQGHQQFITTSNRDSEIGPWTIFGHLRAVEICKIVDLEYAASPGSGESCCKLTLQFIDQASSACGKCFKMTLADMNFPDFLIEKTWYDNSMSRDWFEGKKCLVWWRDENGGGKWWEGFIEYSRARSPEFPSSPWERYKVIYLDDPEGEYFHGPWELHEPDLLRNQCQIDGDSRDKLLSLLSTLEQTIFKSQDWYGFGKLNEVTKRKDFLNRFPVPISPKLIQQRLENNYYRSMDAVKHDIRVMLLNAQSYTSNTDLSLTKMKRLSDWFENVFLEL